MSIFDHAFALLAINIPPPIHAGKLPVNIFRRASYRDIENRNRRRNTRSQSSFTTYRMRRDRR